MQPPNSFRQFASGAELKAYRSDQPGRLQGHVGGEPLKRPELGSFLEKSERLLPVSRCSSSNRVSPMSRLTQRLATSISSSLRPAFTTPVRSGRPGGRPHDSQRAAVDAYLGDVADLPQMQSDE